MSWRKRKKFFKKKKPDMMNEVSGIILSKQDGIFKGFKLVDIKFHKTPEGKFGVEYICKQIDGE